MEVYQEKYRTNNQELPTLTIKDKLNFPYLIATQILTFQKSLLNTAYSDKEVREAVQGLVELIPDGWKDKDWKKDVKAAVEVTMIDRRPLVAGRLRVSEEVCKELGIPAFEKTESTEPYKLFHACINLLNRRGLISQVARTEKIDGKPFAEI